MSATKLELIRKQAAVERGRLIYFDDPTRDILDCDGNASLIAGEIERLAATKNVAPKFDDPMAWDQAVKSLGNRLAFPVKELPPLELEPREEAWPHPDLPAIRTYADIQKLPTKLMRDIWHDKNRRTGAPSEKALRFQAIVNAILDAENQRRSQ